MMKKIILLLSTFVTVFSVSAQELNRLPQIHGTVRGKYEYQTSEGTGRFEVRTARLSVDGQVTEVVGYKAEIDLCDEGQIKMLDAYTRLHIVRGFDLTLGQMRVPFTIDAHRSPHQQYFANRSFIAKQVGNVRDVGMALAFYHKELILQAGLFNGSGLTGQKDYWTKSINFAVKAQLKINQRVNFQFSMQKICPDSIDIMMYDGGCFWEQGGWHIEAEYLLKTYAHGAYHNVHAVDAFICHSFPLYGKTALKHVTPLLRYDFMTNHSDGKRNSNGLLRTNDSQRHRLTTGITFSFSKPFVSDIRINYEKYFYGANAVPKISEHDKVVVEVMTRF